MIPRDGITPQVLTGHDALKPLGYLGAITTTRKEWVETSPGVEVEQEVAKVLGPFGAGEAEFEVRPQTIVTGFSHKGRAEGKTLYYGDLAAIWQGAKMRYL